MRRFLTSLTGALSIALAASAQAQFSTIINVPPDPAPASIASDTQLNLADGGALPLGFRAGANAGTDTNMEVNISGGVTSGNFRANSGAIVNMTGGIIQNSVNANSLRSFSGAAVNISGGIIQRNFDASSGSAVRLFGGEFRLDGVPIAGLNNVGDTQPLNKLSGGVLSGTFADGTPFIFGELDDFANGTLTLQRTALLSTTTMIDVPPEMAPTGAREGQTINVSNGGALGDNFIAIWGSSVDITGGQVGDFFRAAGATVNLSQGAIGQGFNAHRGTVVNVSGGTIDYNFDAFRGSVVTVTGGDIGHSFRAWTGSQVNISGGNVGSSMSVENGAAVNISGGAVDDRMTGDVNSTINWSGGTIGDDFGVAIGGGSLSGVGHINVHGSDFRLNGALIAGLNNPGDTVQVNRPSSGPWLFSGTLEDGTPFALGMDDQLSLPNGSLTFIQTAAPAPEPAAIQVPTDPAPLGVRAGQTLTLQEGGALGEHFNAGRGSTVNIQGGTVGKNFEAVAAEVTISGGNIGDSFDVFQGSQVAISGGRFGHDFAVLNGGVATISGGLFGGEFKQLAGGQTTLIGGEFRLNGEMIAGLETVADSVLLQIPAGGVLSGTLADGSPFAFSNSDSNTINFDVLGSGQSDVDLFDGGVTLQRSAVPDAEPNDLHVPTDAAPYAVRQGQRVTLENGGVLEPSFHAGHGSNVVINGGTVGANFEAIGAEINIHAGAIGSGFDAMSGATVNFYGGQMGDGVEVFQKSVFNMHGGTAGRRFRVANNGRANLFGGSLSEHLQVQSGGVVNFFGGTVGDQINVTDGRFNVAGGNIDVLFVWGGSTVNMFDGSVEILRINFGNTEVNIAGGSISDLHVGSLDDSAIEVNWSGGSIGDGSFGRNTTWNVFGTELLLDGTPISGLMIDQPHLLTTRTGTLSGTLADSTPFSYNLALLPSETALSVALVADRLFGDYNRDGDVDAADYTTWRNTVGQLLTPGHGADGNFNGVVDEADYLLWKNHFSGVPGGKGASSANVPEPTGVALFLSLAAGCTAFGGRLRLGGHKIPPSENRCA